MELSKEHNYFKDPIKENLRRDYIWLILIFILFIANSIFVPRPANLIVPYIAIGIALFSRDKIKWLVFLLFISELPGGFFYSFNQSFLLSQRYNFSLLGLFSCCYIGLVLYKGRIGIMHSRYKIELLLFIFYFVFLLLYSILNGISLVRILDVLFNFIPFLWILALGTIFKTYSDIKRFILLASMFNYLHVISQIFVFIYGVELATFFTGFPGRDFGGRVAYGSLLMMLGLIGNLILYKTEKEKTRLYLFNILLFTLSFVLTATRGYIIAVGIMVMVAMLYRLKVNIIKIVSAVVIFFALIFVFELNKPIKDSFLRLSSLAAVYEGDLTAEGTLSRITERGPKVMEQYKKSPIIGFAFTDTYTKFNDGHVGNQNILLNAGIIGYLIVVLLLIRFIFVIQKNKNRINKLNLTIIQLSMFGYFIIHSSSSQIFAFAPGASFIRVAFLFAWAEVFLVEGFIPRIGIVPWYKGNRILGI